MNVAAAAYEHVQWHHAMNQEGRQAIDAKLGMNKSSRDVLCTVNIWGATLEGAYACRCRQLCHF